MKKIKLSDIESAFEFVNFGEFRDNSAAVNRKTGEIYYLGDAICEDLPEDFDEEDDSLIWLPDKRDLDLGSRLVMDYTQENCPENLDEIQSIFSHRGAYRAFKELLEKKRLLEKWYSFEDERTKSALLEWCRTNNIEVELETPENKEESL